MWASSVLLSFSTIFAVIGLAGVILAAITSSWIEYNVNRREIINTFNREPELNIKLKEAFIKDPLYFSRNYGLFTVCFSDAVPSEIGSFSWIGSPCVWYKDYLPSEARIAEMSTGESQRLWIIRISLVLYAAGIVIGVLALSVGIIGCWRASSKVVVACGIFLIVAVAALGISMTAWHYAQYMERWTLDEAPFYKSWEPILKSTSRVHYGISYVVSWIGIAFIFIGAVFMLVANCALKRDEDKAVYEAKHDAYMVPSYYDKGALMPYYNTYTPGAYGGYPPAPYGTYGGYPNAYYGYMTYGR